MKNFKCYGYHKPHNEEKCFIQCADCERKEIIEKSNYGSVLNYQENILPIEEDKLEDAIEVYCHKSYKWPLNKEGNPVCMPPGQTVPPGFKKHSKIAGKAFKEGAAWQKRQNYIVKKADCNENTSSEEKLLETIKLVLQVGNEAQAIRLLEQYKQFVIERNTNIESIFNLEEASADYVKTLSGVNYKSLFDFATQNKEAFKKGAEWRAELSYSKEEMFSFAIYVLEKKMIDPFISKSDLWEDWCKKTKLNGK